MSLIAASALMIDYVMTVAVSTASSIEQVTSAFPELFPHDTVWSWFGRGYLFIPLVLPVLGMWWLATHRPAPSQPTGQGATTSGADAA